MSKKAIAILLAAILLAVACCACAQEDGDWICPSCGRVNSADMNFCGGCRTEKPQEVYAGRSGMINAWLCPGCAHVCPAEDAFCTKCGADRPNTEPDAFLADKPVLEEIQFSPCAIQRIPLTYSGEQDEYAYTAGIDGLHSFWIEDQHSEFEVKMYLLDEKDNKLRSHEYPSNDPSCSCELTAGETYRILLVGSNGGQDYTLCIGEPREAGDVPVRSVIQDSTEYIYQQNYYRFVAEVSGVHWLEITEMASGQELNLTVRDETGHEKGGTAQGISMGQGIIFTLEAGSVYTICVEQRQDTGAFKMMLAGPNPVTPVGGCSAIGDYLFYGGQENVYEYTATETETFSFSYEYMDPDCDFIMEIQDANGKKLDGGKFNSTRCRAELTAGETYRIIAVRRSGSGNYSIVIKKYVPGY